MKKVPKSALKLKVPKVMDFKSFDKKTERSDSLTLGTLAHFRYFKLITDMI
jgi:hypothetical protein